MEQVSRRHWILVIGLALAMVLGAAALLWRPAENTPSAPRLQAEITGQQAPAAVEVPPYRIAVWQGRVAVFEGAEPLPSTVLETPVDSLPPADQEALERGIPVSSREELAGLLEVYSS